MSIVKDVEKIFEVARKEGRKKLLEHEAFQVCEYFGLPVARCGLATSVEDAVKIARSIGYPVVLKVVSPDVVHKSDVGGVILYIHSDGGVEKAFKKIVENVTVKAPGARVKGVLVQEMLSRSMEVIVGATRDKIFGPVVMFGLGGIFVEVLRDVSFRIAPIAPVDAETMIKEIKGYRILEGYRGEKPRDIEALKNIIIKVSRLVETLEDVVELDLNPIMLYESGVGARIADVRILIG